MTSDNWHKRFGRMWFAIIALTVGIFIVDEFRIRSQKTIREYVEMNLYETRLIRSQCVLKNEIMASCYKEPEKPHKKIRLFQKKEEVK